MTKKIGITFSSGFFGFFAHAGFLAAVRELGIKPVAYSGSSSGAILAAMAACKMTDERIREILFGLKKEDFWDPQPLSRLAIACLKLFRGYTGYLEGIKFLRLLRKAFPVQRIEQCSFPLAVVATNLTLMKEEVFTTGDIVSAIAASGAVPGLFKPVYINGCFFVDGGVINKAPVEALSKLTKVDRILVHFVDSGSFANTQNDFVRRRFSFWAIQRKSVDIGRYEAYKTQCRLVRSRGIEIVETKVQTPALGPSRLTGGPAAYRKAKKHALKTLSELDL
ncbi:MAG: hypothetical protein DRH12_04875 [Deltaproteobacteria bacterium]|nr:MAG: hypothetical protein DRH12_04875 [Deltaproteobacteria bacterium]